MVTGCAVVPSGIEIDPGIAGIGMEASLASRGALNVTSRLVDEFGNSKLCRCSKLLTEGAPEVLVLLMVKAGRLPAVMSPKEMLLSAGEFSLVFIGVSSWASGAFWAVSGCF